MRRAGENDEPGVRRDARRARQRTDVEAVARERRRGIAQAGTLLDVAHVGLAVTLHHVRHDGRSPRYGEQSRGEVLLRHRIDPLAPPVRLEDHDVVVAHGQSLRLAGAPVQVEHPGGDERLRVAVEVQQIRDLLPDRLLLVRGERRRAHLGAQPVEDLSRVR